MTAPAAQGAPQVRFAIFKIAVIYFYLPKGVKLVTI